MIDQFIAQHAWLIILIAIWTIPWKGVALWRAARQGDMWWFVVFLVINTVAILEIMYIFYFGERKDSAPQK